MLEVECNIDKENRWEIKHWKGFAIHLPKYSGNSDYQHLIDVTEDGKARSPCAS